MPRPAFPESNPTSPAPTNTDHDADGHHAEPGPVIRRWLVRSTGVSILIGAILCAAGGLLALHFLAAIVSDPPYPADEIPGFARAGVDHRAWLPVMLLPAGVCGVVLLSATRRSIPLLLLGSLAIIMPFLFVIACFVGVIGPMYAYRPL